ncbi:DUF433 domain-containing protein [Marinobacter sp. 1-3A]|uniref:DUF433 domain-containing protein n=1 Tax=Marinobacter sp. 1-3A TaxID=2582920 RepID=UPI001904E832|nr:DUF433 domain-containing protein [Marinobacter sp. 1-3A]MBK1872513.1 DUF433 domain-containing protein [Marinobacter sp. 1-3A]
MGSHHDINDLEASLLGVGLYTPAEAAAYTGIPSPQIRRWLFGYSSGGKHYPGIWSPQLEGKVDQALGFHDLLEIRFVHAFRRHGVSLQAIRLASMHAREMFNQAYPFTCKRFQTDGKAIFAIVLEETGDESLLDLAKKQYAFKQVISSSLYRGIEYANNEAQRWFPLSRNRKVVLDPARNFGKPVLTETGMTVEAIVSAWHAEEKNTKRVAALYEVSVADVEAAIQFDQRSVV